jgi:hypothetical protein
VPTVNRFLGGLSLTARNLVSRSSQRNGSKLLSQPVRHRPTCDERSVLVDKCQLIIEQLALLDSYLRSERVLVRHDKHASTGAVAVVKKVISYSTEDCRDSPEFGCVIDVI